MGGMSCSNPNSCHPFLLTFGLFTVFLMALYLVRDTLFDNAKPRNGPILSTFNTAKPRQPPMGKNPVAGSGSVGSTDEAAEGFRALRYEDTKPLAKGNGEGSSRGPIAPTSGIKKPCASPVRDEESWHEKVEHLENVVGKAGSEGPVFPRFSNEKSRPSDLEFRPANFVGEEPDAFRAVEFNPYTWHENVEDIEKGNGEKRSQ